MAWRCGSLSRTLISTSKASPVRSFLPRLCPSAPPLAPRRSHFSLPKTTMALGCAQSLMPPHSVVAVTHLTSHIAADARACCELSQGT